MQVPGTSRPPYEPPWRKVFFNEGISELSYDKSRVLCLEPGGSKAIPALEDPFLAAPGIVRICEDYKANGKCNGNWSCLVNTRGFPG